MACGKPLSPGGTHNRSAYKNPAVQPVDVTLGGVERALSGVLSVEEIDQELGRAERAVSRAREMRLPLQEIQRLEARLENLKRSAHNRIADRPLWERIGYRPQHVLNLPGNKSVSDAAQLVINAMEGNHWATKDYTNKLLRIVERNQRLPDVYRSQLPRDLATVLRACPEAGGLVKELHLRGQRGALVSESKIGSKGNTAIGTAYEIMGTAAITRAPIKAGNTGHYLHINVGKDIVTFGDKMTINSMPDKDGVIRSATRRTVESDLRIWRDGREIGVDFKHVKDAGVRGSSSDFRNQVENVVVALKQGQLHEYHFVSNGSFSAPFKEAISVANSELSRAGCDPISVHEYVSSLVSDPSSDGAAA